MRSGLFIGGIAVLVLASTSAFAASAPGLWSYSITIAGMPAMPAMPPEVMAQMRAMGMQMPGMGAPIVTQACITPEQAARTEVPQANQECRVANQRANGRTITGDIVCNGPNIKGTGTFEAVFDSDTHFTQKTSLQSQINGQAMSTNMTLEGRRVSANCGNVRPLER